MSQSCPCGSQSTYIQCCQPVHLDPSHAATPEALMRSRFTAFALGNVEVLLDTWAPETRPPRHELDDGQTRWLRLDIENSDVQPPEGWVRFQALGRQNGRFFTLRETSRFRFDATVKQWFYVDGDTEWGHLSIGRNAPCPCGSGLKAKRCCARD
ncbi:YchJ family protein [Modicisalibacter luteus]|uniref:YchJ family protein n=1 Tax=Modicisalibacter luteus TaxID=453962 RepID=A0ABV7M3F6_9GAMM|nr:YchJ family protein [Halomonas lutea]